MRTGEGEGLVSRLSLACVRLIPHLMSLCAQCMGNPRIVQLHWRTRAIFPMETIRGLPAQSMDPCFEQCNPWIVLIHALSPTYYVPKEHDLQKSNAYHLLWCTYYVIQASLVPRPFKNWGKTVWQMEWGARGSADGMQAQPIYYCCGAITAEIT